MNKLSYFYPQKGIFFPFSKNQAIPPPVKNLELYPLLSTWSLCITAKNVEISLKIHKNISGGWGGFLARPTGEFSSTLDARGVLVWPPCTTLIKFIKGCNFFNLCFDYYRIIPHVPACRYRVRELNYFPSNKYWRENQNFNGILMIKLAVLYQYSYDFQTILLKRKCMNLRHIWIIKKV